MCSLLTEILIGVVAISGTSHAQQKVSFDHLKEAKVRIMPIGYGDWVESSDLFSSKEAIEASFRAIHDYGSDIIYWRLLWEGYPADRIIFYGSGLSEENRALMQPFEGIPYAWDHVKSAFLSRWHAGSG